MRHSDRAGVSWAAAMAPPGILNRYLLLMAQEHLEFRLPVSPQGRALLLAGEDGAVGVDVRVEATRAVGASCDWGSVLVGEITRPPQSFGPWYSSELREDVREKSETASQLC